MVDLNLFMGTTIYGAVLALLALGITLIYMTTNVFNFAHPRLSLVAAYMAATIMAVYMKHANVTPNLSGKEISLGTLTVPLPGSVYAVGFIIAIIGGVIAAMAEYYLILRPLLRRGADYLKLMIATLAYDFLLMGILTIYNTQSWVTKTLQDVSIQSTRMDWSSYDFSLVTKGGVYITGDLILSVAVIIVLTVGLFILIYKTTLGIKMRASVENPPLAEVLGVNVERIYAISWILAGATAGIAGFLMMLEPSSGGLKPISSTSPADEIVVSAFAAGIVGGVNSIFGSVGGGFFIAYAETYITDFLAMVLNMPDLFKYARVVSMFIVGATLLFAPEGIAGLIQKWRMKRLQRRLLEETGSGGGE